MRRREPRPEVFGELYVALLGTDATSSTDAHGTPVVDVPVERWVEAPRTPATTLGMDFLDWLSAVDQPDGDPPGVDVVLHVADPARGPPTAARVRRVLLRTRVPDADPRLASLTAVWPGVAWHERETFEMFGIGFDGFDDGSGLGAAAAAAARGLRGHPAAQVVRARRAGEQAVAGRQGAGGVRQPRGRRPAQDAAAGRPRPGDAGVRATRPRRPGRPRAPARSGADGPHAVIDLGIGRG